MPLLVENVLVHNTLQLMEVLVLSKELKAPSNQEMISDKPQTGDSMEATPAVEVIEHEPPRLFALVIGINEYKSQEIPNLKGAVADAQAVKDYLEQSLGVPTSHIETLLDETAKRCNIIKSLRSLRTNPQIHPGEPILIFYAGHGSTAPAPTGWGSPGSSIQLLVSHDALCTANGKTVDGIPDRTIGVLLEQIAQEKGDNITVIFDCCHSGSLTRRDVTHPTRLVRQVGMTMPIPSDLDEEIWSVPPDPEERTWGGNRALAIAPGFLKKALRSHVLLAACGSGEYAKEENGRGYFTKHLLDTLEVVGVDKVTYTDLVQRIPCLPWQNPQCEGYHQDRICFHSMVRTRSSHLYHVYASGQQYVVKAGKIHGITKGATFAIYNDRMPVSSQAPVATMTALDPKAFSTALVASSGSSLQGINKHAFGLVICAGEQEDLRIHVELDEKLMSVFTALAIEMKQDNAAQPRFMLVEKEKAELDIVSENDQIFFNILDPMVTMYGLNRMPSPISPTPEDIGPVLRKAARYFWHLRRTGNAKALQSEVEIQFTRLVEVGRDRKFNAIRKPEELNLINDGVIDIDTEEEANYGIQVTNNLERDLFVSVFYFDSSDLSISSYFQPPTAAKKLDPPLPPHASITIGYGPGGGVPFGYSLRTGQDVDVGFMKFFLSTEPVDLSCIPQSSPWVDKAENRYSKRIEEKPIGCWHTILLTIVQH